MVTRFLKLCDRHSNRCLSVLILRLITFIIHAIHQSEIYLRFLKRPEITGNTVLYIFLFKKKKKKCKPWKTWRHFIFYA